MKRNGHFPYSFLLRILLVVGAGFVAGCQSAPPVGEPPPPQRGYDPITRDWVELPAAQPNGTVYPATEPK